MTRRFKWLAAVGVSVVFLAGIATGICAIAFHLHHHRFGGGRPQMIAERMEKHLTRELSLTPAQVAAIHPLLEGTAGRLHAIRNETGRRVAETMDQSRRDLAPHLTPAQLARLDTMRERRSRGFRRGALPGP